MITMLNPGRLRLVARMVVLSLLGSLAAVVPLSVGVAGVADAAPASQGYWFVAADGGIFNYGAADFFGSAGATPHARPVVGMAATPSGNGYWLVTADGSVFNYGDAAALSPSTSINPAKPIVGMAATPSGHGYWLVASDGGIFAYGDATFHGSTGAIALNQPIVGMAAAPGGQGYWLVAADGGIFAFDTAFFGSTGAITLNQPIVGMTASPSGAGYWFVAADGGIFAFGDATFQGSMGATRLNQPIVGMSSSATGQGYWLVARDGGIFSFGDAEFKGSTGDITLNQPIVGMATGSSSTALGIGNVVATPGTTTAAVTWTTNLPANSQVEYGTTTGYGSSTALDSALVTNHTMNLAGLANATTYHFRVKSGGAVSADQTFTTGGPVTAQLSSLTPLGTPVNGWGPYERNTSNGEDQPGDGATLTINGTTFATGLGVNANSDIRYALPGDCTVFQASIGVDDEVGAGPGSVQFEVWDGTATRKYQSSVMSVGQGPTVISVDVTGITTLRLVVDAGADTVADHADWANARVTCASTPGTGGGSLSFTNGQTLSAGTNPHSVATADLNHDGKLDLVAANSGSFGISVYLGVGDGTFGSEQTFVTGAEPKTVALGFIDGDTDLDVVTANQTGVGHVNVLLGDGNGAFGGPTEYVGAPNSHEARIADLNADGFADVVVVGWGGSVASVLLNDGTGTGGLNAKVDYAVGDGPTSGPDSVDVADVNHDGKPDLIASNGNVASVSVLLGNGNGTFQAKNEMVTGGLGHFVRVADLNGDTHPDIVTANQSTDNVSVLLGNGNGTFASHVEYPTAPTPMTLTLTDMNGDGRVDIVAATINGNYPNLVNAGGDAVTILLGAGNGTFPVRSEVSVGEGPFGLAVGDFNTDGRPDLVTGNWWNANLTVRLQQP